MIMGPLLAILLMNENAVCALQEAMGPTDPMEARKVSPKSIRALYGESTIVNVIHGTADDAELEKVYFIYISWIISINIFLTLYAIYRI